MKKFRFRWLFYISLWVALAAAFIFFTMAQAAQYTSLTQDLARIHAETERALDEHERLRRQLAFIGTDAYIEEQARQRLGLVLPTELVFINVGRR